MNEIAKTEEQSKGLQTSVNDLIHKMQGQFEMALPSHMSLNRFMRVCLTEIRKNPKLKECTPVSLLGALMQAAQDGLEPGIDGQCFLIPRRRRLEDNSYVMEVNYQRGYQGIIELCRRTGDYAIITVRDVRENDTFDYEEGSNSFIRYKKELKNRGAVICYFAYTKLKDGEESFTVLPVEDATKHMNRFASTRDKKGNIFGVWKDDFDSMALKTVLLMHLKYQPKSVEIRDIFNSSDAIVNYDKETKNLILDMPDMPEISDEPQSKVFEKTEDKKEKSS